MLELSTQPNKNKNTAKIKRALWDYLSASTNSMFWTKRKNVNKESKEFAKDFVTTSNYSRRDTTRVLFENPKETMKIVEETEKEFEAEAKNYGMREKINYVMDGRANSHSSKDPFDAAVDKLPAIVASSVVGAVAVVALSNGGATPDAAMAFLGSVALVPTVSMVKKGIQLVTDPRTKDEKISSSEYIQLKHSQVALKQMKKILKKEVKAEERAEYKQMVSEAYAKTAPGVVGFLGKNGGR